MRKFTFFFIALCIAYVFESCNSSRSSNLPRRHIFNTMYIDKKTLIDLIDKTPEFTSLYFNLDYINRWIPRDRISLQAFTYYKGVTTLTQIPLLAKNDKNFFDEQIKLASYKKIHKHLKDVVDPHRANIDVVNFLFIPEKYGKTNYVRYVIRPADANLETRDEWKILFITEDKVDPCPPVICFD